MLSSRTLNALPFSALVKSMPARCTSPRPQRPVRFAVLQRLAQRLRVNLIGQPPLNVVEHRPRRGVVVDADGEVEDGQCGASVAELRQRLRRRMS